MAEELVMPRLSDTMEQGTIGRWLVHEGDSIAEGDVIAEIETDKATMEFQAYAPGTVLKILVGDGETADLGAPIAIVGDAGEQVPERSEGPESASPAARDASPPQAEAPPVVAAPPGAAAAGNGASSGTLRVSPIARRMADAAGLDLGRLAGRGSGPDGRIVKVDVERLLAEGGAAPAAAPEIAEVRHPEEPAADEVRELTPMLKAIAHRMAESKATVPHFYVTAEVDMTRAVQMRAELNEGLADRGGRISLNDLIVRACAMALLDHPQAHRSYVDGRHLYHAHANIGIAVALDDGLIVPVVREADARSVLEISAAARDLAVRARSGGLKQREIEGATFTVSNLGMFGVSQFSAIINPPESAILAVGATVERPVVVDGQMAIRSIMAVTLACDHRACSGADGARLLQTITRNLQAPSLLLA
jgi:pyruvate dehydrogenase E2 component (dihydrolipoyllysine-residue acetyltransferase)